MQKLALAQPTRSSLSIGVLLVFGEPTMLQLPLLDQRLIGGSRPAGKQAIEVSS